MEGEGVEGIARGASNTPLKPKAEPDMTDPSPPWKTREMRGGRWQAPVEEGGKPKRADKNISIRVTEAELAELDAQIAEAGLNRNRALRIAVRRIAGFLEVDRTTTETLRDLVRQITGISRNVNQLAKHANRTKHPDLQAFLRERAALGKELSSVEALLQQILEVQRRRADGLRRLEVARDE